MRSYAPVMPQVSPARTLCNVLCGMGMLWTDVPGLAALVPVPRAWLLREVLAASESKACAETVAGGAMKFLSETIASPSCTPAHGLRRCGSLATRGAIWVPGQSIRGASLTIAAAVTSSHRNSSRLWQYRLAHASSVWLQRLATVGRRYCLCSPATKSQDAAIANGRLATGHCGVSYDGVGRGGDVVVKGGVLVVSGPRLVVKGGVWS